MIPLDVAVDTRAWDAVREGWYQGHRKAVRSAFKGEAYRLMRVMQAFLRAGVGEERAELTRAESPSDRPEALASFASRAAYTVRDGPGDLEALVGLSSQAGRRKRVVPEGWLGKAVAGERVVITRDEQARIAYRLRKKRREPVANVRGQRYSKTWHRKRQRVAAGKREWADLSGEIPPVGEVIHFPQRDYPALIVAREADAIPANVLLLYEKAMAGERWARTWWAAEGVGAKPTAKGWIHSAELGPNREVPPAWQLGGLV